MESHKQMHLNKLIYDLEYIERVQKSMMLFKLSNNHETLEKGLGGDEEPTVHQYLEKVGRCIRTLVAQLYTNGVDKREYIGDDNLMIIHKGTSQERIQYRDSIIGPVGPEGYWDA